MATPMANSRMHFVREQMSAAVGNSSIVVKVISCAVIIGYILSFISYAVPFMTITPGYVMPPNARVYSFFMFCFVELHFWHVIADISVVVLCGKLLEPLWGAPDMILFFVIVNFGVGIMTGLFYIVAYLVTLREDFLFDVHIHGLAGYIAGFCVAVKQVMPDHCVATMPFGKLRNTHIPLSLLVIVILLRLVGALPGPYPYMFGWGIVISWIYLRFYQKHSNGNRGDLGDNFSFASTQRRSLDNNGWNCHSDCYYVSKCFFPNHLQPLISIVSNFIFNFLVKVKICKKPQRRYDVSSPTTITVTLPGSEPHDAERRKQLALKALNDRLNKGDNAVWQQEGNAPTTPSPVSPDPPPTAVDSVHVSIASASATPASLLDSKKTSTKDSGGV